MSDVAACTLMSVSNQGFVFAPPPFFNSYGRNIDSGSVAHQFFHSMGTGVQGHFLGVKRSEHEIDHSAPSNVKVKN
jgi:hypothetical protein